MRNMEGLEPEEWQDQFCKLQRTFQQNVKAVPEEQKEADKLGGQQVPARESEVMTTGASCWALKDGGICLTYQWYNHHCHHLNVTGGIYNIAQVLT